jgi:hypothetical protein
MATLPLPRRSATPYPELAHGETMLAEARLGADTGVLTNRRLVVAGAAAEQSFPLQQIAMVSVRFERLWREVAWGAVFVAVAFVLFSLSNPVRIVLIGQMSSVEAQIQKEQAEPGGTAGVARMTKEILTVLQRVAALISPVAWLLLLVGLARAGLGAFGRTVVSVFAGGGEAEFAKRGRDRGVEEFAKEVGRALAVGAR